MKIINVVGARPNFMKIAPLIEEMKKHPEITQILVHTEQHYDQNMSKLFFDDLGLPKPNINLRIGSGSHAEQTARIMIEFEKVLLRENPDLTLVVGDVNSCVACALTSIKLGIPVAHVEAGLRSFDRTMPEEINRIVTDAISDFLFITEKSAKDNLLREGKLKEKIFFTGNVMIDTLLKNKKKSDASEVLSKLNLKPKEYAVLTLHRPANVDVRENLERILEALEEVQKHIKIVYPIHPRTKKMINEFRMSKTFSFLDDNLTKNSNSSFFITEPLGYLDFLKLISEAKLVLTDSGGIQEETTVLGVPCLTLRKNTERPITIKGGTNILVGTQKDKIVKAALSVLAKNNRPKKSPEKWDGLASKRIIRILLEQYELNKFKEKG